MYNNCFKWVKLKSSKPQNAVVDLHEALLCTFYSFPCPVLRMDSILICNLPTVAYPMISTTSVWHPYLCIVLLIIPNVELTFLDTSAHCLEGRTCVITLMSLSSSLTFKTLPSSILSENYLCLFPYAPLSSFHIKEHFPLVRPPEHSS